MPDVESAPAEPDTEDEPELDSRRRDDAPTPGDGARARRTRLAARPVGGRLRPRTRGMTASEIRALFAVASRPEVVSLAGGMPYLSALPLDVVGDALARLVAERGDGRAAVRLRARGIPGCASRSST